MRSLSMITSFALVGILAPLLGAIDHSNLDESRPLRFEDAYPVASGEFVLEAGAGALFERKSSNRGFLAAEALYGVIPNAHVSVGTTFSSDPHDVEGHEKSGDIRLSTLYNFNQETMSLPAFAVKAEANFPTGVDSDGTDVELKGIMTKSFGRTSLHLNTGYAFLGGEEDEERGGRYKVVLGASYPLGAPEHTRTTLVADLFTEQSVFRGEKNFYGAEVGVRYQLGTRSVIDAGVGSELEGPDERSPFYFTTGISYSF